MISSTFKATVIAFKCSFAGVGGAPFYGTGGNYSDGLVNSGAGGGGGDSVNKGGNGGSGIIIIRYKN